VPRCRFFSRLLAASRDALGFLRRFRGLQLSLACRSRCPSRARHFADARISGNHQLASVQRCLLEICRFGGKDLPPRDFLPQHLNRSHARELAAQTLMVLFGGGKPHSVVGLLVRLVAQDEHDPIPDVDSKAAEHRVSPGRRPSDRVEHELMRHDPSRFRGEESVVQIDSLPAARLRHRTYDICRLSGWVTI